MLYAFAQRLHESNCTEVGKLQARTAARDFEEKVRPGTGREAGLGHAERRTSDWVAGPGMVQRGDSGQDVRWSRPTKRGEAKGARRAIRQERVADWVRGFPVVLLKTFVFLRGVNNDAGIHS